MKTRLHYLYSQLLLIGIFMFLFSSNSYASHYTGFDLTYSCIGPNQYRVTLKVYRDCDGMAVGSSQTINYSSATCGVNASLTLNVQSVTDITPLCPSQASACGGSGPIGIELHVFQGVLTLPNGCSDWILSSSSCCRNSIITNLTGPSSNNIYVQTTLNNALTPCNSSPNFANNPQQFACVGQAVNYQQLATDPDGDVLVYSMVNCLQSSGTNVTYAGGFSGVNPLTVPITLNTATGQISFTANVPQVAVLCVLVREYRGGVLISSIMRDIQFNITNCSNTIPTLSGINGAPGVFTTSVCEGGLLCFDINASDVNAGQVLTLTSSNTIPGATFTQTGSGTNKTIRFCWNTSPGDLGTYFFSITARDNACPLYGQNTQTYTVNVVPNPHPPVNAGTNQSICAGNTAALLATTAAPPATISSFTWTPTIGLSSPNTAATNATPTGTTAYNVSLLYTDGCISTDDVIVTVLADPAATVTPATGEACGGGTFFLTGTTNLAGMTFQWFNPSMGSLGTGAVSGTNSTISVVVPTTPGNYTYRLRVTNPNGCMTESTAVITVGSPPALPACVNIYVTPTGSNAAAGTQGAPTNLTEALNRARCNNSVIKMSTGIHTINAPLTIGSFVTIEGGFNSGAAWVKSSAAGATTIFRSNVAPEGAANAQRLVAFYGNGATNFRFQDVTITTAPGTSAGMSTYGVHLTGCTNYNFVRTRILPGAAAAGSTGSPGSAGANGSGGSNGANGSCDANGNGGIGGNGGAGGGGTAGGTGVVNGAGNAGTTAGAGRNGGGGGAGGAGGATACNSGKTGGLGGNGSCGTGRGTTGGVGGGCGDPGGDGSNGGAGTAVAAGGAGTAGAAGTHVASFFVPGALAGTGANGCGGGGGRGGGGGGSQSCFFCNDGRGNGAGGGGGGGQGGTGGTGGRGGGGSFSMYLVLNGASAITSQCTFTPGAAGAGGIGGAGGAGGNGGNGGARNTTCTSEIGEGGAGGAGSAGRAGGAGGNGAAGVSTAVHLFSGLGLAATDIAFNLAGQPTITAQNRNCTGVTVNFTNPTSVTWNFTASASPQSPVGTSVNTVFNALNRYNVIAGAQTYTGFHNVPFANTIVADIVTNATVVGVDTFMICQGNSANFASVYFADSYTWNFGGAVANPGSTVQNANLVFNTPGFYPITLIINTDCCGASPLKRIYLQVIQNPTATGNGNAAICSGGSRVLTLTGLTAADSVVWTPTTDMTAMSPASTTVSPSVTTTYTATIRKIVQIGNRTVISCPVTRTFVITVNATPTLTFPTVVNPTCNGNGSARATVAAPVGNYNFVWSNAFTTLNNTTSNNTSIAAGTYYVTATHTTTGCSVRDSIILYPAAAAPNIYLQTSTSATCGMNNGTATVNSTGGTGIKIYTWSSGGVGTTRNSLAGGSYTVTVTDASLCRSVVTFDITQDPSLSLVLLSSTNAGCTNTGIIEVEPIGGTSPYTFVWTGTSQTTSLITGLGAGTYTVTLSDVEGCAITMSVPITAPTHSTPVSISPILGSQCPNTTVTLTASGGVAGTGSTIRWYSGANGSGFLGSGTSINITTNMTATYYARREGTCNNTADASVVVNVKYYIYAANGATTNTYCTDNSGWNHFFIGDEIIYSVIGNLSGAPVGFPRVTIWDAGAYYQESAGPFIPASCATGYTPGEERFEMERSWNLDLGGGAPIGTYNTRFYYQPAERTAIENAAIAHMAAYPACAYTYKYAVPLGFYWFKNTGSNYTAPDYDDLHLAGAGGTTNNSVNYAQQTGITSFSGGSGAIILIPNTLLPLDWLYFNGTTDNKVNYLTWGTEKEDNTDFFNIEHSLDGVSFTYIGTKDAQGTSTQTNHYSFNDVHPFEGANYYRIKLVDLDGAVTYSKTILLTIGKTDLPYKFYPNPTDGQFYYEFQTAKAEELEIKIIDALGKLVNTRIYKSTAGINNLPMDLTDYPAGVYMVQVLHKNTGAVHIAKVIKNKN